ncbi:GDT1-like protein 4 isoform X5 [Panicum virgatum]|uniref:GDT1-like protein 4 isoform X5 n=1 Tax=Panicum virgatum TaxID=38727 RepID=UPI0019D6139C|nr:GDT1-like protein 4 isoform X5 [Panicum virgatum]
MHRRAPAAALLVVLVLSVSVSVCAAADQVANGTGRNGTGAGAARLDRRTKMFLQTARARGDAAAAQEPGLGLFDAFFASLFIIVVSEVLSTGLGIIVPNLISRKHTNSAATVLYAFFGLRLLYIAWRSDSKASQKKEIEERRGLCSSYMLTYTSRGKAGSRSREVNI